MQTNRNLFNVYAYIVYVFSALLTCVQIAQADMPLPPSVLLHSYAHGALANQTPSANVGADGVVRTQLSWQNNADIDVRLQVPAGYPNYNPSEIKPDRFPKTTDLMPADRTVWWAQKVIDFNNGQAKVALDVDVSNGIANAPNQQRIENIYLSGNLPSGTYKFAVENYDYSGLYANNPSEPATYYNATVTASGQYYILPRDNLPLDLATGHAFAARDSVSAVGDVNTYSFDLFKTDAPGKHATGIDLFPELNRKAIPRPYLQALHVPLDKLKPNSVDYLKQQNPIDILLSRGELNTKRDFDRLFGKNNVKAVLTLTGSDGQTITIKRADFINAFQTFDKSRQLQNEANRYLSTLPETTLRELQTLQSMTGRGNVTRDINTPDHIKVLANQVNSAVDDTAALHANDQQLVNNLYRNQVKGNITTNAKSLFTRNQQLGYDGQLLDMAYVDTTGHGDVLAMSQNSVTTVSDAAAKERARLAEIERQRQIYLAQLKAAEEAKRRQQEQAQLMPAGETCTVTGMSGVPCDTPGAYRVTAANIANIQSKPALENNSGYGDDYYARYQGAGVTQNADGSINPIYARKPPVGWVSEYPMTPCMDENQRPINQDKIGCQSKVTSAEFRLPNINLAGRSSGAIQFVGGSAALISGTVGLEVSASLCMAGGIESFGVFCIPLAGDLALMGFGADNASAGVKTVVTGEHTSTITANVIGADTEQAVNLTLLQIVAQSPKYPEKSINNNFDIPSNADNMGVSNAAKESTFLDSTTAAGDTVHHSPISASVDNVSVNTPAITTAKGYINGTKMDTSGSTVALEDLTPTQQSIVKDIMANGDAKGVKTEALVSSVAKDAGYIELEGAKYGSNNGFDHVLQNPDGSVTIIVDSKPIKPSGAVQMGTSQAGTQLSEAHIRATLENLPLGSARTAIRNALDEGTLKTAVAGIDKETGQLVITPIYVPPAK